MIVGLLSPELLGILLAAIGAITWAMHYLFIRIGLDDGRLLDIVTVALVTNVVIVIPIAVVLHYPNLGLTPRAVALFAIAGIATGLFGRVFQYQSTRVIGASRTSPIIASAGLISALLAVMVLDEQLTTSHLVGILLIVLGVAITSWDIAKDKGQNITYRELGLTLSFPLLAAILYGLEPIVIKIALEEGTPFLIGMAIMILSATLSYFAYRRLQGPIALSATIRGPNGIWYVAAAIAGTTSFIAYFAALDVAPVVFVIPIFQTSPLLVAGLSLVFLPDRLERVTWVLGMGALFIVVGAILVTLAA